MPKRLTNKVALVTGAGRGIGRAISIALAEEGSTVILAARSIDQLKETAEKVIKSGGQAEVVICDLTEEQSIKNLVKTSKEKFARLDILVNNAGVTHSARFEETSTQDWDRCFKVNARAAFILCREILPLLRKAVIGHIVNIGSVVSVKGYPLQSAYTASKHALRGMTISLAEELKGTNIRVHLICPGGVNTLLVQNVRPDIEREDLIAPEEIAELVVYLVTHKGNAIIDELHIRRITAMPWFD